MRVFWYMSKGFNFCILILYAFWGVSLNKHKKLCSFIRVSSVFMRTL